MKNFSLFLKKIFYNSGGIFLKALTEKEVKKWKT